MHNAEDKLISGSGKGSLDPTRMKSASTNGFSNSWEMPGLDLGRTERGLLSAEQLSGNTHKPSGAACQDEQDLPSGKAECFPLVSAGFGSVFPSLALIEFPVVGHYAASTFKVLPPARLKNSQGQVSPAKRTPSVKLNRNARCWLWDVKRKG
ncbi:uncharacterized protein VTP21DRAFT_1272 [Calcarisporiella thermophila]|uniref:uncharacterized protein n=1 Tax=Calcarisporiella thermophila TaxID=911321 RepID=UPI003743D808